MVDEKKMKAEFRKTAQKDPERYYPVETLKEEGFMRKQCPSCQNYFWTADTEREVCGEPECAGGYTFINNSPAGRKMDFIETWQHFSKLFKSLDYTPIPRYPLAARWRDDTDFVQASIYDFQPYVVSGEIDPPANPLVVPQFCVRFNDTDNVGITGRHYTGFVMIGQHSFQPPGKYVPNDYLNHIYQWLIKGMKLPKEEIQFHEDSWAGGGNMGPSMEFFSRGLEIGNQVYMQYDIKSGSAKELGIKVLDMGMGQERPAWFTHGTSTSYEAVFPTVVKKLYKTVGIKPDYEMLSKFLPYSGLLNVDEREDVNKTWIEVADAIKVDVDVLKENVLPLSGIYSIGDHTRSLLVALTDGALPSNVGGGYNLRSLARRSLDFINRYEWDLTLPEVTRWHADYLKPQYPELMEQLDEVEEILSVEMEKYKDTRKNSQRIAKNLSGKDISLKKLIELYDSQGISPQMLKTEGVNVDIPADFYIQVANSHEKAEQKAQTKKFKEFDLSGIPKTDILYYDDFQLESFQGMVLKIIEDKYVILDRTAFYPTSGGQMSDRGNMSGSQVVDIFKQGNVVLHRVEEIKFKTGDTVSCSIEMGRRLQLAQHHTATHLINGVARELLGEHIWQAGAEKTLEKARLDITHFAGLTREQLEEIERGANKAIGSAIPVESMVLKRDEAEKRFGFRLYQGGAVPGLDIRVIRIEGLDVEACGGTHLKNTSQARLIKIIGSTKIQDGVVRIEFTAGDAAFRYIEEQQKILLESAGILKITPEQLPKSVERFFTEWKELRKENERLKAEIASLKKEGLKNNVEKVGDYEVIVEKIDGDMDEAVKTAQGLKKDNTIVVLFSTQENVNVVGMSGSSLEINMNEIVKPAFTIIGGGGGGKPDFVRGAGKEKDKVDEAIKAVLDYIKENL